MIIYREKKKVEEGMKGIMKSKYGEKRNKSLKKYLKQGLLISDSEAHLIESVIKDYYRKFRK
jgi:hypothetical protein